MQAVAGAGWGPHVEPSREEGAASPDPAASADELQLRTLKGLKWCRRGRLQEWPEVWVRRPCGRRHPPPSGRGSGAPLSRVDD